MSAQRIDSIRSRMHEAKVQPGPKLSSEELSAFERKLGIKLPAAYRTFVLRVGNGARGPDGSADYDLYTLDQAVEVLASVGRSWAEGDAELGVRLQRAFPLKKLWRAAVDPTPEGGKKSVWSGAFPVGRSSEGEWVLVVTGKERGKIWELSGHGAVPNSPRRDFLEWYDYWLDGAPDDWSALDAGEGGDPTRSERDPGTGLPTRRTSADPLQAQRDILTRAAGLARHDLRAAIEILEQVVDETLQGQKRFALAQIAVISSSPDAEQRALAIAREWLAPPVVGSVNQTIVRSELLKLLEACSSGEAQALREQAQHAPTPELLLPDGDFF
jgi:hypothetical protein